MIIGMSVNNCANGVAKKDSARLSRMIAMLKLSTPSGKERMQ